MFLRLAFLFFIGSVTGWVLELFFRRFLSKSNPERKWINPGACTGPYLPIYGCGLCALYIIASISERCFKFNPVAKDIAAILIMAAAMTLIEYISGYVMIRYSKVRLWDYSGEWGNIMGIICPKFSLAWAVLAALYYFFIHPYILEGLNWFADNLAFSFVIGMFFGVFIIDAVNSAQLIIKLKRYAEDNDIIVKFENLKVHIRRSREKAKQKYHFFAPFRLEKPIVEYLKSIKDTVEQNIKSRKK